MFGTRHLCYTTNIKCIKYKTVGFDKKSPIIPTDLKSVLCITISFPSLTLQQSFLLNMHVNINLF